MIEQIGYHALNGFLWAVDRCFRIGTTVGVIFLIDWLFPFPEREPVKLADATVSDLTSAMILPCLVVIFFYMVLRKDE